MERTKDKVEHTKSIREIIDTIKKLEEEYQKTMAKNPKNIMAIVRHKYCLQWEVLNSNGYL